jgi:hypothetical protein
MTPTKSTNGVQETLQGAWNAYAPTVIPEPRVSLQRHAVSSARHASGDTMEQAEWQSLRVSDYFRQMIDQSRYSAARVPCSGSYI